MSALLALTRANIRSYTRDRAALFWTLAFPLIFIFMFGLIFQEGGQSRLTLGWADEDVVVPAYDDAAGVTAEFNRNVLRVLNRELGADFDVDAFVHVALWDPRNEWIEMRLRATRPMTVHLPALDLTVRFTQGEELHTEISAKFRPEGVRELLAATGFALTRWWSDADERFGLALATAT